MAFSNHISDHSFGINTLNRCFSSRKDRRNNDAISIIKRCAEILKQITQTGVTMRLNNSCDSPALPRRRSAGTFKYSVNFDWMMGVVIIHFNTLPFSRQGEASLNASKLAECMLDCFICDPKLQSSSNGSKRVLKVMLSQHRKRETLNFPNLIKTSVRYHNIK